MFVREFWKIPFLRLIIPFIAGILLSEYFTLNQTFIFGSSLFFIALTVVYRPFLNHDLSYHKRWIFGTIVSINLLFIGIFIANKSKCFDSRIVDSQYLIGIVNESPKIGQNSVKFVLKVKEYQIDKVWNKSSEKIFITLESDSNAKKLEYGDLIQIKSNLKEIKNAGNPSEFDYKKYLARNHIHFKSYQNSDEWNLIAKDKGNPIFAVSYKISNKLLNIYRETGIKGEEFGLLAALTLGTKDFLSDEIIEAYSESGAMHVLSVSGLHVGIILIVLSRLFFFLKKKRYQRIIQSVVIILIIWFFALLTGLSPSVNRSAAMITFVIIGNLSQKRPSTYNSVAASAFILLFIDPLTLFNVGFQLSYLAVISLIFFYQRIYQLYEPKNYFIDKIWSLTSVSIAAQIGTSALSIYYFHQFPVYAILSNLIVVPVSFVIMVLAIALLLTSFILPVAKLVAYVLSGTIWLLNSVTKLIEGLPLATIEPISLNSFESILIHLSLVILMIYIVIKNRKLVPILLFVLIMAFCFRDFRYVRNKNTQTFTVYNVPKKSAFSVIQDGKLTIYSDSGMYKNPKAIAYLTSNIMANDFITKLTNEKLEPFETKNQETNGSDILKYLICIDSLKILYLHGDLSRFSSTNKLKINYLVLSKNAQMDLTSIMNLFEFNCLIADASVSKWKQEILKKDCQQMAIPFYNVSESGAFIHQIRK